MTTLRFEPQQGAGEGGDVSREYVDLHDRLTLQEAKDYADSRPPEFTWEEWEMFWA